MTCSSCAKARAALAASAQAVAAGNVRQAVVEIRNAGQAVGEKVSAEAARVRALMARR